MKNLKEKIKELIKQFPNNYELGEQVRMLFNKIKKDETD
jgi:hypothetical protein